jgi:hypothetical protein
MSRTIDGNIFLIYAEPDGKCEDCGKEDELRPYGKNGANVCFECMMKDEANAKEIFRRQMAGDRRPKFHS